MAALISGLVFALGLGVSGMTRPSKVIAFLDVAGMWDPSMLFVMVGAIAVSFVSYRFTKRWSKPLFAAEWRLPTRKDFTPSLVVGSMLFGVGWGLGGFCPAPALTSLVTLDLRSIVFSAGMVSGMLIFSTISYGLRRS